MAKAVEKNLARLALGAARVEIIVGGDETIDLAGDEVTFLLAANPGSEPAPLAKVASGGELARTMLALRLVLTEAPSTLVFDEVDSGIGGAVAEVVGRSLKALGSDRQVLAVTHLPQVAAQGDSQWTVAKAGGKSKVRTSVTRLDRAGRVEELARMLGGTEITATTRKHAAELLGR